MRSLSLIGRVLLAIGLVIFGFAATQRTSALLMRRSAPDAAYNMGKGDARILALHAERLSTSINDPSVRAQSVAAARQSLMRDPTNPSAAVSLAIAAETEGKKPQAQRLVDYSLKMSRRDLRAHLWSIEVAVARGDIPVALHHYDTALRTSRAAPDLLFPVLASALPEPEIRQGVERILSQRPTWKNLFLNWLGSNSPDSRLATTLFINLGRRGVEIPWSAQASLMGGLVRQGAFAEAWQIYAAHAGKADRNRSRQVAFDRVPEVPSPFDWNMMTVEGLSASIQQGPDGAVLAFDAVNGVGGVAARQLQFLPAGRYAVRGKASEITGGSGPYWQLVCPDGSELGRVTIAPGKAAFAGTIEVPASCPVQWFNLYVPVLDMAEPVAGMIERVVIEPAQGAMSAPAAQLRGANGRS